MRHSPKVNNTELELGIERNLEVDSRHPKTKFSMQRRFICPRGTGDREEKTKLGDKG